jgi:hypothetical protein
MKKILLALLALAFAVPALAQGPGPSGGGPGPVPDPWTVSGNNLLPGGRKVVTTAPTTGAAGFNLPHGTAPTVPVNGDTWTTTTGMFVRINGATVGPFATANSFAATSPLGVSFPGGVVTYALSSPVPLSLGGLGGSQAAATAGQVPVCPGSGGACVPTTPGTFFSQNYATPPAIGGTTPAAGAFSSLVTGLGTGQQILSIKGGGTNANDGSAVYFYQAGANTNSIGNYSAILGGAFDDRLTLYGINGIVLYHAVTLENLISGGNSCLFVDSSGTVQGTGSSCGTGSTGSGTVASGTSGYLAYYGGTGTTVSGLSTPATLFASPPAIGGTTPAAGTFTTLTTGTSNLAGATTVSGASFGLSGNIAAAAWTTNGVRYKNVAATLTDTSSSGTVAAAYTDSWGGNTIAASSATTYTNYYGSYFSVPVVGTNVTFTHAYALGADSINTTTLAIGGSAVVARATNAAFGAMEGDGTTISCTGGVCTAIGGGGGGGGGGGAVQNVTCLNNSGDYTLIQNALNTGNPVHVSGSCSVTTSLGISSGQYMYGDGRTQTVLTMSSGVSTAIYCNFSSVNGGPIFQDFGIVLGSSSATGINCDGNPRFKMFRMRVSLAGTCLSMNGNSGGAFILDFECGAYSNGITGSGSLDTVTMDGVHCWNFGGSAGYIASATCVNIGRMDDLKIANLENSFGNCITMSSAATFGEMSTVDCDGSNGIIMAAGEFTLSSYLSTIGSGGQQSLVMTGGNLTVASFVVALGAVPGTVVSVSGGATLNVSSGNMILNNVDATVFGCSGGDTSMNLNNVFFSAASGFAYSNPKINQASGCRVTLHANRITDKGSGAGTFINLATDDWHNVVGNAAPGWTEVDQVISAAVVGLNNPAFPH